MVLLRLDLEKMRNGFPQVIKIDNTMNPRCSNGAHAIRDSFDILQVPKINELSQNWNIDILTLQGICFRKFLATRGRGMYVNSSDENTSLLTLYKSNTCTPSKCGFMMS